MKLFSDQTLQTWGSRSYATNVYGLARTLLATGSLITLLFNSPGVLFKESLVSDMSPICNTVSEFGIWCLLSPHLELARWLSIGILLLVISGWRPRFTGPLHWWVAYSYSTSATMVDGGDQITTLLTFFLIPLCLLDSRANHWQAAPAPALRTAPVLAGLLITLTYWTVRMQVALIYFEAAIGKMYVTEWVDGTALYYWFTHPTFGAYGAVRELVISVFSNGTVVAFTTWGVILFEVLLFMAVFLDVRKRKYLLAAGILFHLGIVVIHGLMSFFFAMSAALVLYLQPWHMPLSLSAKALHFIKRIGLKIKGLRLAAGYSQPANTGEHAATPIQKADV